MSHIHDLYIFGILKTFPRRWCENICNICTVESDIFGNFDLFYVSILTPNITSQCAFVINLILESQSWHVGRTFIFTNNSRRSCHFCVKSDQSCHWLGRRQQSAHSVVCCSSSHLLLLLFWHEADSDPGVIQKLAKGREMFEIISNQLEIIRISHVCVKIGSFFSHSTWIPKCKQREKSCKNSTFRP